MTRLATDALTGGTLHDLPPEAGDITAPRFEPDEHWLRGARPELQKTAIWRWFATRYEEMEGTTPRDVQGQYFLGVKKPPVGVDSTLRERFGALVEHQVLDELIADAQAGAGNDWVELEFDKLGS